MFEFRVFLLYVISQIVLCYTYIMSHKPFNYYMIHTTTPNSRQSLFFISSLLTLLTLDNSSMYFRKLFARKPKMVYVDEIFPEFLPNGDLILPPNPFGVYSMKQIINGEEVRVTVEYTPQNTVIASHVP